MWLICGSWLAYGSFARTRGIEQEVGTDVNGELRRPLHLKYYNLLEKKMDKN